MGSFSFWYLSVIKSHFRMFLTQGVTNEKRVLSAGDKLAAFLSENKYPVVGGSVVSESVENREKRVHVSILSDGTSISLSLTKMTDDDVKLLEITKAYLVWESVVDKEEPIYSARFTTYQEARAVFLDRFNRLISENG